MVDNWRALALGARRIPDDPAEDPVAQALGSVLGLDQEALASKMQRLSALQQRDPATGMAPGMAPPGSERADLGLDVASAFSDLAGIIRAYHGSPHLFDRFDMGKIGTGEGAQAYGHGLYFAENPEVAKGYMERLSGNQEPRITFDGAPVEIGPNSNEAINSVLIAGNVEDALADLNAMKGSEYYKQEGLQEDIDWLNDNKDRFGREELGSTYTADLDVNHEDLLDWDLPLSQQPRKIEDAGADLAVEHRLNLGDAIGARLYKDLEAKLGAAEASARIRAAGIPGIRYLDQGSRAGGEGSRNLVIFDDLLVKILERNGEPIR